jgi:hypothetical protein
MLKTKQRLFSDTVPFIKADSKEETLKTFAPVTSKNSASAEDLQEGPRK